MSLFDPQHVYYHTVRSTRKGQVLQQKPIHHQGAYDSDEIPRALGLLKTYGYHIYPPRWRPFQMLAFPFQYSESNLSYNSMSISFNSLYPALVNSYSDLSQFIENNPNVNNSTIFDWLHHSLIHRE